MHIEVIEVMGPRLVNPKETSTMSDTMTLPRQAAPAAAVNGAQMHAALEAKAASLTLGDRLRALPGKAASTLRSALAVFRLESLAGRGQAALAWLRRMFGGLLGRVGQVGFGTIAGVVLTAGKLRHTAVRWVATAARIAATPVRWVWAGISWALRSVGLGKAVSWVDAKTAQAGAWAGAKVEAGMTWLDANEDHSAMRWGRAIFQATFIQRALALVFPWASAAWVYVVALFFAPTFGELTVAESTDEEAAIQRAADKYRLAGDVAAKAATADAKLAAAKVAEPVEMVRDTETGALFTVKRWTHIDGSAMVTIDGTPYEADAVDPRFEFGTVVGTATEAEVKAASGPGPKLHGPMNRAARRAK